MTAKRSLLRVVLRLTLALIVVIGFGFSFYYNQRLAELRQTKTDLRTRVGLLEVDDPSKVAITGVPVTDDAIPPGVSKAHVWQYRIRIPANYGPCYHTKRGLVKADSPQGSGGSSGSWSGIEPEPKEELIVLALVKDNGKWIFCRTSGGGSSSSNMPDGFSLESLDGLVIEPIVAEGETRVFDPEEAICLFRLREQELATNRKGEQEKDLYRGLTVYVFSQQHQDAFDAWADGRASSMKDVRR